MISTAKNPHLRITSYNVCYTKLLRVALKALLELDMPELADEVVARFVREATVALRPSRTRFAPSSTPRAIQFSTDCFCAADTSRNNFV